MGVKPMDEREDQMDEALHAYLSGKDPQDLTLEPYQEVLHSLEPLREVPDRSPERHSVGRNSFLKQAKSLPPVSTELKSRLKGWKNILRKERLPMSSIVGIVLAIALAFGGAGTAAYASQDSLPTEPLYAVKQLTEELRLVLTIDPQEKADLLLNFVSERVREMQALSAEGEAIPQQIALRLETHLHLALQAVAQLDDAEMVQTLTRLQQMTQSHLQTMDQLCQETSQEECLQLATRAMLQAQRAAEEGLDDPVIFRNRQGTNRPEDAPEQPEIVPPGGEGSGSSNGDGSGDGDGAVGQGDGDGSGEGDGANGQGQGDGDGTGDGANGQGDGAGTNAGSGNGKK